MDPLDSLERSLRAQIDSMSEFLLGGGPATFDEYTKAVGSVTTLRLVLDEVQDLKKKLLKDE